MERRGFLKTLVGSITSAGLLLRATPSEVKASGLIVAPDAPVILSPHDVRPQIAESPFEGGQVLYDARGRPVAFVTQVDVTHQSLMDVTSHHDHGARRYTPGYEGAEIRIAAVGLPDAVDWLQQGFR